MLRIGSKRSSTHHVLSEEEMNIPSDHQDHISSTGRAGMLQQMGPTSNSYTTGTTSTAPAALLQKSATNRQLGVACRIAKTSSTTHTAPAAPAHCSSGVLAPQHNTTAPLGLLAAGTHLLPPLASRRDENASSRCLQESSLQARACKAAPAQPQNLQNTATAPAAAPTFSTKAFWQLTAALEEDELGCAAAACLTASAGKHHHTQHTAPAAQQQQLLQQQAAVLHPQPQKQQQQQQQQQQLLTSPEPKFGSLRAGSGFRRLQTTPGAAMFSAVLNSMPGDDTDTDMNSDVDQNEPFSGSRHTGFTAVLQQELQAQLGAAAAGKGISSAGTPGGAELVPVAALPLGHSSKPAFMSNGRGSRQSTSPTTEALVAPGPAPAAAAAGVTTSAADIVSTNKHGPAGPALVGSAGAGAVSAATQAAAQAADSSSSTPAPAEVDAEQFLVACLQPGVVQALAVLVHADILPLCSEDGSGSLMATLAYMLILASRSSILQTPASGSSTPPAASSASDTHKLLTLLWMTESFSSQYRDSCKLVLFDYMFYPACVSMEDPKVAGILQPHTLLCVQLQAAVLGASSFRLWVQPEELAAACQTLAAAEGGSCLVFLQAAVQAHVCKLQQEVQQQVQQLLRHQMAQQQEDDDDLAVDQEAKAVLKEAQQHVQPLQSQQMKQPGAGLAGLLQQSQQHPSQVVTSRQVPQDGQQPGAGNSRAAKKPRVAAMQPPAPQQQQRRRSQRNTAKGEAAATSTAATSTATSTASRQEAVQVQQPLQKLQQDVVGRQTRSNSRMLAAAQNNSNQKTAGSCISGAACAGMLPAASAAAGKAAALLQSTMRSAKQQLLQMASSLGKRTHQQMHSSNKCGKAKL